MGWPCPTCGKELTTERGMGQHHTTVHGEPLPNQVRKGCGTEFHDSKAQRRFCDDCNPNAGEHDGNREGGKETAVCVLRGNEFEYYPSDKKGMYCPECVAESEEFLGTPYHEIHEIERVERKCEHCGVEMTVLKSEAAYGHGRFCSQDRLSRWKSENWTGESHHNWKGRYSVYGRRWWQVRKAARERDEHTCQHCGVAKDELGREPDVHHSKPVRTFDEPQEAHSLENLVCLCPNCHVSVRIVIV